MIPIFNVFHLFSLLQFANQFYALINFTDFLTPRKGFDSQLFGHWLGLDFMHYQLHHSCRDKVALCVNITTKFK